mgnify:CR=1 FL=1
MQMQKQTCTKKGLCKLIVADLKQTLKIPTTEKVKQIAICLAFFQLFFFDN